MTWCSMFQFQQGLSELSGRKEERKKDNIILTFNSSDRC